VARCSHCEAEVAGEFRYCPWCATPTRSKLVEFFRGADDDEQRALRVFRYLAEQRVRFSVWDQSGTARAAVSLDDDEAARLAGFLAAPRRPRRRLLDDLRALTRR
jgi:hypothetical protein